MASTREQRPGEFALIAKYFRPLAKGYRGALGLVDDAAFYRPPTGADLVLTLDTIAADVHFAADDPPVSIARKALRVNLSDLAAKGAIPVGYLMSLALPHDWSEDWIARFAKGLAGDQRRYGLTLFGGDTTRASGGLTISITAIGRLPSGKMVRRSGATPGDSVFVTGTIGDAALALAVRRGEFIAPDERTTARLDNRYLHPQPRVALASVIRRYANSAMDVSDGLVGDLAHICEASGVGAELWAGEVPLSSAAKALVDRNDSAFNRALTGGDDYEILSTVSAGNVAKFVRSAADVGVKVSRVGSVVEGKNPPIVLGSDGKPIAFDKSGHAHF